MAEMTTSVTGGMKGEKPCQLASVPPAGLRQLGEVCGMGAKKYALHNYRKGYEISKSLNALMRHVLEFMEGKDVDEESGLNPLAHAAWHCLNAIQTLQDHPEFDDRFVPEEKQRDLAEEAFLREVHDGPEMYHERIHDEWAAGHYTGPLGHTNNDRRDLPA